MVGRIRQVKTNPNRNGNISEKGKGKRIQRVGTYQRQQWIISVST